jgi:regulatory protein
VSGRRRESFAEGRERRGAIDDPALVLEAAARFLEARARSIGEVRRRLTSAGYRADLIDGAIDRMTELGMLDDATFARAWTESRDRARPRGERALRHELGMKGIERSVVDEVMAERRADTTEDGADVDTAAAERLLARNARALERVADPRARRQRAYQLLARNGFDSATCASASVAFMRGPDDEEAALE